MSISTKSFFIFFLNLRLFDLGFESVSYSVVTLFNVEVLYNFYTLSWLYILLSFCIVSTLLCSISSHSFNYKYLLLTIKHRYTSIIPNIPLYKAIPRMYIFDLSVLEVLLPKNILSFEVSIENVMVITYNASQTINDNNQ